jgi:hypothetical protein
LANLDRSAGEETFRRFADDLDCERTPHGMPFDREHLELCAVYAAYAMHFALDI